jgi:fluoride exporter
VTWVCVALGAAVGAPLRFVVSGWLDGRLLGALPWGTLTVNTAGSLLLGWFAALALDGPALALLGVGFCGGLTTYSSFAVQVVALGPRRGSVYAALTLVLGQGACALGWVAG